MHDFRLQYQQPCTENRLSQVIIIPWGIRIGFVRCGFGSRGRGTSLLLGEAAGNFTCSSVVSPLAQTKPISDSGIVSVIVYLRRQNNCWGACSGESSGMWEKQLCRQQGQRQKMGGRCSRREILLHSPVRWHVVPLQGMAVNAGADIHLQPTKDSTLEHVALSKGCNSTGSPHWSSLFLKYYTPWNHTGAVREEQHPMGKTHW